MTIFKSLRLILFIAGFFLVSFSQTASASCNTPTGLTTTGITNTSAVLQWNTTSADSFLVRYHITGTTIYQYKTVTPGTSTSVAITGLYPNTNYSWVVKTWCNGGASGSYPATPIRFTTLSGSVPCLTPNNTLTTAITPNSATISWNSSITADSFLIRYSPKNTTNYTWIQLPGSVHSYTFTGLPENTGYDWRVRCICSSLPNQAYSSINTFTTLSSSCPLADPYYFTPSNITDNSADISWKPVPGALGYNFRYALRFTNDWVTTSVPTNATSLSGLLPTSFYEYQVQVQCPSGAGPWTSSGIFQTAAAVLTVTRGPYLNQSTTSSIIIRWRTNIPSDSRVDFGTSAANLNQSVSNPSVTTEHIVQLTGLSPYTRYYYSIGSSGTTLQGDTGNVFRTNPPVGSTVPVRIWTIGDFGVSSQGQNRVRDAYMNYAGSANTNVWLWVGDNAYVDGTDAEYSNHVFGQYPYQMKKWVIWPATGNHDLHSANASSQTGPYFDMFSLPKNAEAGGLPSGTEAYYSFNYANIHFICLESTDAPFRSINGQQVTWLVNDLAANTQRWTIVYFHHPPYSKGSHNSDTETQLIEMRTNIVPILETYKVDLVLSGHSHSYERSMMIKGHLGVESTFNSATMAVNPGSGLFPAPYVKTAPSFAGTVYAVCGVSGQIGSSSPGWPHNAMYYSSLANHGSLVIDVTGDRLDCKFLTALGGIADQFSIQKIGTAVQRMVQEKIDPAVPAADPLLIFPNPLFGESTIRYLLTEDATVRVEITDMTGRVMYTLEEGHREKGQYEIPLHRSDANLPAGIYFLRMVAGRNEMMRRFVVAD